MNETTLSIHSFHADRKLHSEVPLANPEHACTGPSTYDPTYTLDWPGPSVGVNVDGAKVGGTVGFDGAKVDTTVGLADGAQDGATLGA